MTLSLTNDITGKELAARLGCSDSYARRLFRDGCPPRSLAEVVEWVNASKVRPGTRNKGESVPLVRNSSAKAKIARYIQPASPAPAPAAAPVVARAAVQPARVAEALTSEQESGGVLDRVHDTEREMLRLLINAIATGV